MKKFSILIALLALCQSVDFAQTSYNTYTNDNYSAQFATSLQPAALADNRYKWGVGFGGNYSYSNNYIGSNINNFLYASADVSAYKKPVFDGYYAEAVEAVLISGFLELTPKDAIGYSWKIKRFTNFDGLDDKLSQLDYNSFTDGSILGDQIFQGRLAYNEMTWAEHNLTYSRVLVDRKARFMKAGATVKILNGLNARYLYTDGGNVTFQPNNDLEFDGMEFQYGESDEQNQLSATNIGVGFDIGFVYEHRPKYKTFFYEMDRKRRNPSKHANKYKWKAGASITNIGGIKYTKDTLSYNFINDNNNVVNYIDLFNSKLNKTNLQSGVLPNVTNNQLAEDTNFRMSLPTALNLQFDYQVLPNIYVNYTGSFPLYNKNDPSKVHDLMINTVSGRYETANWSVGIPISFQRNGQVNMGVYGRIRNVFFGANNATGLIGQRKLYNANIYAGVVFGIKHKMPNDTDFDLISDGKDLCPLDSGGYRTKGCPDADGDKIPDYQDFCPYEVGKRKYNGCPDTDKDGILDYQDHCPTEPGLRANSGCPDTDKDGIIDGVDRCPTIPGVYQNNGCPLEPLVCCLDSDADGVMDEIDSCRYEPGPASNNGCPVGKVKPPKFEKDKYLKIEKKTLEETLKDKKAEIKTMTVREVLNDMTTIDDLNVYFDVDKSDLKDQYERDLDAFVTKINMEANTIILILGHTDSDGDATYNLALSNRRSERAKQYLIKKGVSADRIIIKNYGEEKPAEDNTNTENKSKNRRVEVRIMDLHN